MTRRRTSHIVTAYVLSLLMAIGLLVFWVIYIVRSGTRLDELGSRVGVPTDNFHWFVLTLGCVLFALLIGGLTYQLVQALVARRYSAKQEEFISNITHEMKSPLAAIKVHAQTLRDQPNLDSAMAERSLKRILQQSDRMAHLVDNVLESSRLLARREPPQLEPVRVPAFFASYFEETVERLDHRGVRLVPHLASASSVMASEQALHRVMDNLLDNAERFSARGGEVRCRVTDQEAVVLIEVEDDGIGVPKKELAKIFDRFYQAARDGQRDGRRRGGTGLGLSIVSQLVRQMGGEIRAYSQEGRPGTRFVIELPMTEPNSGASTP
ncbi:MAG: HAMP domain-containing sensor histidine kinase [Acidobacteriota bacterium]